MTQSIFFNKTKMKKKASVKTFFIKNGTNFLFSSIAVAQYRDRLATYENKGLLKISKFVEG